ncbi:MAG: hypothetical protein NVV60_01540 [Luteimonas sp.]|nr:hypothetical protein [Luteimonas sp.]
MHDIDWMVIAAWVQAVGSILAILVAILIGNRQHRQNVELVEAERKRIQNEADAEKIQRADDFKFLLEMVFEPLQVHIAAVLDALGELDGSIEPIPRETRKVIHGFLTVTKMAIEQLDNVQPVFMHGPRYAIRFANIRTNLATLKGLVQSEADADETRLGHIAGRPRPIQSMFIRQAAEALEHSVRTKLD